MGSRLESKSKQSAPGHGFPSATLLVAALPASRLQPKLAIGEPTGRYEREADRVAKQVVSMPEPSPPRTPLSDKPPALRSARTVPEKKRSDGGGRARSNKTPPPAVLREALESGTAGLGSDTRNFMESRFGFDFSSVRIHTGPKAAAAATSNGARAFTVGDDIVFGGGQYRPEQTAGRLLLAHELTHVLQQGAASPLATFAPVRPPVSRSAFHVQCSPLSDQIAAANRADPSVEALLARLARADVQGAQTDSDVDVVVAGILAGRPDDLWVAQQIRQGRLIENSGSFGPQTMPRNPIRVHFFRGRTNRRALVIAGVHGSEPQGIEVAQHLIRELQAAPQPPALSVIVVPSLFPDNALARRRHGSTPTNRNFPEPSRSLATAPTDGQDRPLAAPAARTDQPSAGPTALPILTENILLLALMERFRPERIISIHGTWRPGAAGVFYDPRRLTRAEVRAADAEAWEAAAGGASLTYPEGNEQLELARYQRRLAQLLDARRRRAEQADRNLSLAAARAINRSTSSITGREGRHFERERESSLPAAQAEARRAHPSVAGNVGPSGNLDTAHWSGNSPAGYSLGEYAPPRGMSVFTVEPPLNCTEADYGPGGSCRGRAAEVDAAERRTELMSYADAIRTVLLE